MAICTICIISTICSKSKKRKKEHKVEVYGDVKDSFTQAYLKAFVTVMDKDSNVIDTMTTSGWGKHLFYHTHVPARPASYIIKAECEGYEIEVYQSYHQIHRTQ